MCRLVNICDISCFSEKSRFYRKVINLSDNGNKMKCVDRLYLLRPLNEKQMHLQVQLHQTGRNGIAVLIPSGVEIYIRYNFFIVH